MYLKASVTLPEPGTYAIHLAVYDNAGNSKVARKVLLYDDSSTVEKTEGKFSRVATASQKSGYKWVDTDTSVIVTWKDMFINIRHKNNRWLYAVKPYPDIESKYDDNDGNRTISSIHHVHGEFAKNPVL